MARNIHVSDRAAKMSIMRSTDAFSVGIALPNFNLDIYFKRRAAELAAIPFTDQPDPIRVGLLTRNDHLLTDIGERYVALLRQHIEKLRPPVSAP